MAAHFRIRLLFVVVRDLTIYVPLILFLCVSSFVSHFMFHFCRLLFLFIDESFYTAANSRIVSKYLHGYTRVLFL